MNLSYGFFELGKAARDRTSNGNGSHGSVVSGKEKCLLVKEVKLTTRGLLHAGSFCMSADSFPPLYWSAQPRITWAVDASSYT